MTPAVPWNYWDLAKAAAAVVLGTMIANLIAVAAASPVLEPGQKYENNSIAYAIVLVPTMVVVELLLLAAALWFGHQKYKLSWARLGLRQINASWWLPVALALASLALVYGYQALLSLTAVEPASTPDQVFESIGPFMVVALGAVLLAPWIEEIFFRGFLYGGLRHRWGWVLAAIVSSLVFALAHLDVIGLPVYAGIGFLFAWAYQCTGSIKSSIIAHLIVNAVTLSVGLAVSGV